MFSIMKSWFTSVNSTSLIWAYNSKQIHILNRPWLGFYFLQNNMNTDERIYSSSNVQQNFLWFYLHQKDKHPFQSRLSLIFAGSVAEDGITCLIRFSSLVYVLALVLRFLCCNSNWLRKRYKQATKMEVILCIWHSAVPGSRDNG